MKFEYLNVFPTTIYIGEIENHLKYKKIFYDKIYEKFQYEQVNKKTNSVYTTSENVGNPFIHLEIDLDPLFGEICAHVKNYLQNVLLIKDIFDIVVMKTWLSRSQGSNQEIPWHIHSPSHFSFIYYLNIPKNSHMIQFSNDNSPNAVFSGLFNDDCEDEEFNMVKEYNDLNCEIFYMHPHEGNVILFPSKLSHSTKSVSNNFNGERLGISGDIILVLKEEYIAYSHGYIHEKYWKKYK
jgi:hypothetical protein